VSSMSDALRAEWTKLRTVPSTGWLLLAVLTVTVGVSALAAGTACPRSACAADPVRTSLTGVGFGQALVAGLAVSMVAGENAMLRLTFASMPRRVVVLTAKAVLAGVLVAAAAIVAVGLSLLAGQLLLPAGVAVAGAEPLARAALGSVAYLVLIGWLSLGVSAAIRDSAAAVGTVLGLLYVVPIVAAAVSDPDWQRRLQQVGPMSAGLAVQATRNLSQLPIGPWAGMGVLAAWSLAMLLVGGTLLRLHDA